MRCPCVQTCNKFLCFTVSSAQQFFWKTPCLELFRLHGKSIFLSALHYQKHQYCLCVHLFGKQTAWPSTHLCSYHLLKAWAVLSIQKDERRYKVTIIHTGLHITVYYLIHSILNYRLASILQLGKISLEPNMHISDSVKLQTRRCCCNADWTIFFLP